MRIIVIGSGLLGLTTAYFLRQRQHDVVVLDRAAGPGAEGSFANGGLLTPSMSDPWNAPGCWRVLLASLGQSDAPMQLRLSAVPGLVSWGVRFLRSSSHAAYESNTRTNLRLSQYSLEALSALRQQVPLDYGRAARGSLRIFRSRSALEHARKIAERRASDGLLSRVLSVTEVVALEPALAPIGGSLEGGIHYREDEVGDAYRFCVGLKAAAQQAGVRFRPRIEVQALSVRAGLVDAVVTSEERLTADRYIVAAGSYSAPLLHGTGVHLPVRPVKGYSVTFLCPADTPCLSVPVVDDERHAVVTPLDGAIRVAGTAEFAGYDLTMRSARIQSLTSLLRAVLPNAPIAITSGIPWCGLRPMSADGVPIIGGTTVPNLFVNTGHGHLGWTMAAGSGQLLTQLICEERAAIDPTPYSLARFRAR